MKQENSILRGALVLTLITLIAGFLLGTVYFVTEKPIARAKEAAKQTAYQSVLADAAGFEGVADVTADRMDQAIASAGLSQVSFTEAAKGLDGSGNVYGYVITVTSHEGYGGDIVLSVGIAADGTVTGIEPLSISETAGLGMKATESSFKDQFAGKNVPAFSYTKTKEKGDDKIDALSGATITTNAVTNAVNGALVCFREITGGNGQ